MTSGGGRRLRKWNFPTPLSARAALFICLNIRVPMRFNWEPGLQGFKNLKAPGLRDLKGLLCVKKEAGFPDAIGQAVA